MEIYDNPIEYEINPRISVPYNSGKISKQTYIDALKYFNSLRYAAGISYNINVTNEYNKLAQDASLLMQLNDKMAHKSHSQPKKMSKAVYDSGVKGCAESNIGTGHKNLQDAILGWVSDVDP